MSDESDQLWLDDRVADVENGIEAVLDIYRNWTDGRHLARLHEGSAFDYVMENVPRFRLGRPDVPALLMGTNLSFSAVAQLTDASIATVLEDAALIGTDKSERVGTDGVKGRTGRPLTPSFPTRSDLPVSGKSRATSEYGDRLEAIGLPRLVQFELDALAPDVLIGLYRTAVDQYRDTSAYARSVAQEVSDRAELRKRWA